MSWLDERIEDRPRLRSAVDFGREYLHEFREDRTTGLASEIGFWWILTLLPAGLVFTAVLAQLDVIFDASVSQEVQEEVVSLVTGIFGEESDTAIQQTQDVFESQVRGLLTVSLILALWSTAKSFVSIIEALDIVYDLEERRGYLKLRLFGMVMGLGTILMAALSLAIIALGPMLGKGEDAMEQLGLPGWASTVWNDVRYLVAGLLIVVWTATIFHVAPSKRTRWRWDLPGAILTAALWLAATGGFGVYLRVASDGSFVVGVLGGILVLMMWFWLLAIGLLAGGQLNALLIERAGIEQRTRPKVVGPAIDAVRRRIGFGS